MLGGESGVGKTSVVAELARTATIQQLVVVAGECQPIGGGVLHPLVPLLGRIIDRAVEGGPAATATLFGNRARVLAAIEPNVSRVPGFADCPQPDDLPGRRGPGPAARRPPRNDRGVYRGAPGPPDPRRPAMGGRPHPGVPAHDAPAVFRTQRAARARDLPFRGATATVAGSAGPPIHRSIRSRTARHGGGRRDGRRHARPDRSAARVRRVRDGSIGRESVLRRRVPAHRGRRAAAATDRRPLGLRRRGPRKGRYEQLALPASLRELVGRRLAGLPDRAHGAGADRRRSWPRNGCGAAPGRSRMPEAGRWMRSASWAPARCSIRPKADAIGFSTTSCARRRTRTSRGPSASASTAGRREPRSRVGATTEFPRFQGSLAFHYERAGDRPRAIEYLERASEHAAKRFADRDVADYLTTALRLDDEEGRGIESGKSVERMADQRRDGAPRARRAHSRRAELERR